MRVFFYVVRRERRKNMHQESNKIGTASERDIIASEVARFMHENGIELDWCSLAWVFRVKGVPGNMIEYMPMLERLL